LLKEDPKPRELQRVELSQDGVERQAFVNAVVDVRFQILKVTIMKMAAYWVVAPCSLVQVY
jgi:hypothetical protein